MTNTKQFKTISKVDVYIMDIASKMHPNVEASYFLGGSFARGEETALSDIDYTACINEDVKHSRFYFEIITLDSVPRLLSVYFYSYNEVLIDNSKVDDEIYLWMKLFLPATRFVGGDRAAYDTMMSFYSNLSYTRKAKSKTVHKSFGKLLELIARIKKWHAKDNFVEMAYYGTKLAEHVRRLVIEVNGPIAVASENNYLQEHFALPKLPKDFKELYLQINRYTDEEITLDGYRDKCISLVKNTAAFMRDNQQSVDEWTLGLLNSSILDNYIDLNATN